MIKPYDTPIGEPVRTMVMTEKFYKEKRPLAEKFMRCFVQATKTFIDNKAMAEKYVRETVFKGQITKDDFDDAIGNSPYSYDITPEHIQITTDVMVKTASAAWPSRRWPRTGSRPTCWKRPRKRWALNNGGASHGARSASGWCCRPW
jgi:ABC-type nitrate/sulfonate/bicarbonate transport system substrate-binding protein